MDVCWSVRPFVSDNLLHRSTNRDETLGRCLVYYRDGMEETDINELLTSHNQEFSNKKLLQLELHFANEEDDSDRLIEISKEQNLTSKQISKAMCLIDEAMEIFLKNDPDRGRSLKVSQVVATNINCYKELYLTLKKKAVQQTMDPFL
ncbi:TIGD1 [Cordylochernes scorpioides]|uniref:TIGD1 n=1 Tax=Cordylochernes scorpioides TaxID=51811 RepID=A0ABY6KB08_9ARAC|nr:TIGD1 [Cordylochernes scorpioides]